MSTLQFQPAVRSSRKLRAAVTGVAGAGKTMTGLAMACALSDKVAVIDTDGGQANLFEGTNGWAFSIVCPTKFSPKSLEEWIAHAESEGYGALLVDNFSDYWSGEDGMLEQADKRCTNSDPRSGWKAVRPDERSLIKKIKTANLHVIVTMRVNTEYGTVTNQQTGKETMQKIGLKPDQRGNIDSEFDLVCDMDADHTLTVTKSRIAALDHAVVEYPDGSIAVTAAEWLAQGTQPMTPLDYRHRALTTTNADDLLTLFREVQHEGMEHTAVIDAHGAPLPLGKMITHLGREMRDHENNDNQHTPVETKTTTPADRTARRRAAPGDPTPVGQIVEEMKTAMPSPPDETGADKEKDSLTPVELAKHVAESLEGLQNGLEARPSPQQLTKMLEDLTILGEAATENLGENHEVTQDVRALWLAAKEASKTARAA